MLFLDLKHKGEILIDITVENDRMHINVEDNGNGIPEEKIKSLGKQTVHSKKGTGTALFNINERLVGIYNGMAEFHIQSEIGIGTKITISIPLSSKGVLEQNVKSIYSG